MLVSKTVKFVALTFIVHLGFLWFPQTFLFWYQYWFFPVLRKLYDFTFGLSPFPVIYFVFFLLVVYGSIQLTNWWPYRTEIKYTFFYKYSAYNIGKYSLVFICCFFWFWGFHYYQKDFVPKEKYDTLSIDQIYVKTEVLRVVLTINEIRKNLSHSDFQSLQYSQTENMEMEIRNVLKKTMTSFGYPAEGRVRVRSLAPEGFLLRFSTAGIYIPYVFEGHVDKGLHALQIPFTLAHEMAHGYGITDEGDCNTLAYLVCLQSKNKAIQYSGLLAYLRYLWNDSRMDSVDKNSLRDLLSPEVKNDIMEMKGQSDKYPDVFPRLREFLYESYLLCMGVDDGLMSYYSIIDKIAFLQKENPEYFNDK